LLSMNINLIWSFYTFVIAGLVAVIGIVLTPSKKNEVV
jgi:MFS transporter, AAHS family, benzoate transport protein